MIPKKIKIIQWNKNALFYFLILFCSPNAYGGGQSLCRMRDLHCKVYIGANPDVLGEKSACFVINEENDRNSPSFFSYLEECEVVDSSKISAITPFNLGEHQEKYVANQVLSSFGMNPYNYLCSIYSDIDFVGFGFHEIMDITLGDWEGYRCLLKENDLKIRLKRFSVDIGLLPMEPHAETDISMKLINRIANCATDVALYELRRAVHGEKRGSVEFFEELDFIGRLFELPTGVYRPRNHRKLLYDPAKKQKVTWKSNGLLSDEKNTVSSRYPKSKNIKARCQSAMKSIVETIQEQRKKKGECSLFRTSLFLEDMEKYDRFMNGDWKGQQHYNAREDGTLNAIAVSTDLFDAINTLKNIHKCFPLRERGIFNEDFHP